MSNNMRAYLVTGGAGFVGANYVRRVLSRPDVRVTVVDNFSTGSLENLEGLPGNRLTITECDLRDLDSLAEASRHHDVVVHFASNSDIAKAATSPDIDFDNGTRLTSNVLEAMRINGIKRVLFPSGSGVYGEVSEVPVAEDLPQMRPVSTYGASKLASEALISAYSFMFGMTGTVLRLANVVGPHQTHGVGYDFVRRLRAEPEALRILGDGSQSKPYVHVDDVLDAFDLMEARQTTGYDCYNVGPADFVTVRDIADIVVSAMGLRNVRYDFTGGNRGWKADVPVYRLDTQKIRSCGWTTRRTSREAVEASIQSLLSEWPA
jgi:UDP-glucose 4-epimerase